MILSELIERSPIRVFEQSIHGGLKQGEIGLIASLAGVGKTSVLVQLALDKLLQGKKVIHVSFTQHTHHVLTWYENIFNEFISRKNLENENDVKDNLVKNRVLMNFNQDGLSPDQIFKSLRAMIKEGGFNADSIIIDGLDFTNVDQKFPNILKEFATELGISIWCSCSVTETGYDSNNIPLLISGYADLINVIIVLEPKPAYVELSVSKDREPLAAGSKVTMRLDPKTLLLLGK